MIGKLINGLITFCFKIHGYRAKKKTYKWNDNSKSVQNQSLKIKWGLIVKYNYKTMLWKSNMMDKFKAEVKASGALHAKVATNDLVRFQKSERKSFLLIFCYSSSYVWLKFFNTFKMCFRVAIIYLLIKSSSHKFIILCIIFHIMRNNL